MYAELFVCWLIFSRGPAWGQAYSSSSCFAAPCSSLQLPACSLTVLPQVSAYGFITSNYQQYSDHYFEREKQPVIFYANHDLTLEAALWRSLHNAGILRLYQR